MPAIYIEGKLTKEFSESTDESDPGGIAVAGHLLLIFKDDLGREYVIRGGPSAQEGDEGFGKLVIQKDVELQFSNDSYKVVNGVVVETPESRGRMQIDLGGRDATAIWAILDQHAQNIHDHAYDYVPNGNYATGSVGYNSNGVIGNLLSLVGIDVANYLPDMAGVNVAGYASHDTKFAFEHTITGTSSNDILFSDDTLTRFILDGQGSPGGQDTVSFERLNHAIGINLHTGSVSNGDVIAGVDQIIGTRFADRFDGPTTFQQTGTGTVTIHGGGGDDQIEVLGTSMIAFGDGDNDTFHIGGYLGNLSSGAMPGPYYPGMPGSPYPPSGGGSSSNPTYVVHGGDGYDRIIFNSSVGGQYQTVNAGSGTGTVGLLNYDGIEDIVFDASFINVNGGGDADTIRGGLVLSTIRGGNGADILYARGSARDYLYGDEGADRLYGNGGDEIHGGSGNDLIYAGGGAGQSFLYGDDGNDSIFGGDGNDVIYGGRGNDIIYGGDGDDIVNYTYSDGSLVSITNHGSYFEVVMGISGGWTQDANGMWNPVMTYETDLVYGCETLLVNGNGWPLTPDFAYPFI